MKSRDFPPWLMPVGRKSRLLLYIQPKASKSEIMGEYGNALKVRISAPPVDGKANQALIRFFAGLLGIPKAEVVLEKGDASRRKVLQVGIPAEKVLEALG